MKDMFWWAMFLVSILIIVIYFSVTEENVFEELNNMAIQEEEKRIDLISSELEMDKKYILSDGADWKGQLIYKTADGAYIAEFDGDELTKLVKK